MGLNLVHLVFSLTIDGTVEDRFALFGLRRGFPEALKRATCGRAAPCSDCRDTSSCRWFPLFGQPLSTDPEAVRRHQKPPLPFAFSFPLLTHGPHHCSGAEVGLTLVGDTAAHAGAAITAMEELCAGSCGQDGPDIILDGIFSQGAFGQRQVVTIDRREGLPTNLQVLSLEDIAASGNGPAQRLSLVLTTPLRLFRDGRVLRGFDAPLFLRGLVRRVSSLAAAYGDGELQDDFRWLAQLSREMRLTESRIRFDAATGMTTAGLVGAGCLTGDLEPFLPYLRLGPYLHAGKGASWGFGRFHIEPVANGPDCKRLVP